MLSGISFEPFTPDVSLEDGRDMTGYGWNARIIHTPGHSKGSISILTEDGSLICGDLFGNIWGKILKSPAEGVLEKLNPWSIKTVYPGHGSPFPMERIMEKE
jgi:glyoxylase-like metal-dependent hydrolase (beta-lactamase superfamily II)